MAQTSETFGEIYQVDREDYQKNNHPQDVDDTPPMAS
jgi:hypothetical protein